MQGNRRLTNVTETSNEFFFFFFFFLFYQCVNSGKLNEGLYIKFVSYSQEFTHG